MSVRCFAPGNSALNPCERAMSKLSGMLAGVVLPAFKYGNHLKASNQTYIVEDVELAKKNMEYAAGELKSYWTQEEMFQKPINCTYVPPTDGIINQHFSLSNAIAAEFEAEEDINPSQDEIFRWISRHAKYAK